MSKRSWAGSPHDVLALAGPPLAVRKELFDFIVSELKQQEDERTTWKVILKINAK